VELRAGTQRFTDHDNSNPFGAALVFRSLQRLEIDPVPAELFVDELLPGTLRRPDARDRIVRDPRVFLGDDRPVEEHHHRSAHVDLAMDENLATGEAAKDCGKDVEVRFGRGIEANRNVDIDESLPRDDRRFVANGIGNRWRSEVDDCAESLRPQAGERVGRRLAGRDELRRDFDDIGRAKRRPLRNR